MNGSDIRHWPERGSGQLAIGSHFGPEARCPKTTPPRWPQVADSIWMRFGDIAAHKQMILAMLQIGVPSAIAGQRNDAAKKTFSHA